MLVDDVERSFQAEPEVDLLHGGGPFGEALVLLGDIGDIFAPLAHLLGQLVDDLGVSRDGHVLGLNLSVFLAGLLADLQDKRVDVEVHLLDFGEPLSLHHESK